MDSRLISRTLLLLLLTLDVCFLQAQQGINRHPLSYPAKKAASLSGRMLNACADTSGSFLLKEDSTELDSYDLAPTSDGNLMMAAFYIKSRIPTVSCGYLAKTDLSGQVLWARRYENDDQYAWYGLQKVKELNDGNLLLIGSFQPDRYNYQYELWVTKTDPHGAILWTHTYKTKYWFFNDKITINDIVQDHDGNIYLTGNFMCLEFGANTKPLLFKLSSDGNILWSKTYFDNSYWSELTGTYISGPQVHVIGFSGGYTSVYQLDAATGDTIRTTGYKADVPFGNWYRKTSLVKLDNGHVGMSGILDGDGLGVTDIRAGVAEFDDQFNFLHGYSFHVRSSANASAISLHSDGSGIFTRYYAKSLWSFDEAFVQFQNGQLLKERWMHNSGGSGGWISNSIKLKGGDLMVEERTDSVSGNRFAKMTRMHYSDTASACLGMDTALARVEPLYLIPTPVYMDSIVGNVIQETHHGTFTAFSENLNTLDGCTQVASCDTIKIHGPVIGCAGTEMTFTAFKNPGCGARLLWDLDTSILQERTAINDTTLAVTFRQGWQGYIKGQFQNGCGVVEDSVLVTVSNSLGAVQLGADTVLCPGSTIRLQAHKGYISYLWQDESTDSTLTVRTPGTYFVQAKDGCGTVSSDTVVVRSQDAIAFDLGSALTKCNNDTLILSAPGGFTHYQWSPSDHVFFSGLQTVHLFPSVTTQYKVTALHPSGCSVTDSIVVNVLHSASINLGRDTSICKGQPLTLMAPDGFESYTWNTGAKEPSIEIDQAGQYSVRATDQNSCTSSDTIVIYQVLPGPAIHLDRDSLLCTGQTKMLNAGAGYASYNWNNGADSPTIPVSHPGMYSVAVTDQKGCKGYDTVVITGYRQSPAGFLPRDTALCNYETLAINSLLNYRSYTWSNGSHSASIDIKQPGSVWLEVEDAFGCKGRDTIQISEKSCLLGFFIPNAFTPNKDGKNDVFRPLLFGNIKQYHFVVYDRWGHVVFESSTPRKGWDGAIQGNPAGTSVYVWLCNYQLEGEEKKQHKGTVVVIR